MNIRTVTYFTDLTYPLADERIAAAGKFVGEMKAVLTEAGYSVQTTRLAGPSFPRILEGQPNRVVNLAQDLEAACFVHQVDYSALGPVRPDDAPAFFEAIPAALGATQNVFASAIIADPVPGLSLAAVRRAAEIIHRCATLTPDGFANLRFAALANVPPGSPFLPAAYHDGGPPQFAIGLESADLAVSAFADAPSLAEGRARFTRAVESEGRKIGQLATKLAGQRGVRFGGIDFSLAPFPETARSLATALERLTGGKAGEHGTLAAAAYLADALDRTEFKRTGFSGLFLPLLEDATLALRAREGVLTITDLLLYSAVCGTGLDTVPLPGDVTPAALAAILVDMAALALRLNKPLTARLMPIPGKRAGDEVQFDFAFFASSRVLEPRASGLGGLFGGDETFHLAPRSR